MARASKLEAKLQSFIDKLKAGKTVQNRDLATWLGAEWVAGLEQAWTEQMERRQEVAEKPDVLLEYEALFKKARFLENKADGYSRAGNRKQTQIFRAQSETAYEILLERYQELIAADYSLHTWFDRMPDFTAGSEPSLCAEAMPHVRTSRSLSNTSSGHGFVETKRAQKLRFLEQELAGLTYVDKRSESEIIAQKEHNAALLKEFLKITYDDQY